MSSSRSSSSDTLWLLLLLLVALIGCVDPPDDDDTQEPFIAQLDECPDGLTEAVDCEDVFCGDPIARVATGHGGDSFILLQEGGTIPIESGGQSTGLCCHHFELAVEVENLCPVTYLTYSIELQTDDGPELIYEFTRHVQMLRIDSSVSSLQRYWPWEGSIPCAWYPEESPLACGDDKSTAGFIDQHLVTFRLEARDHDGRTATHEVTVQPTFTPE